MSSWLVQLAQEPPVTSSADALLSARDALFSSEPRNIIELGMLHAVSALRRAYSCIGAGTGIVSLTLGALRSTLSKGQEGRIFTTDLGPSRCRYDMLNLTMNSESAMPLLEHNVSSNETLLGSESVRPRSLVLDWDAEELPPEVRAVESGFDAIIMADVTYNTASFPSLVRTISSLVQLNPSKPPVIVLGYKERDPAERTLWDMAKEIGVVFERVGERKGAGGQAVEIWVGLCEPKS